ncbi:hypothetical protein ACRAKI_14105 [Saccharothrix isguenensis]
MPVRTGTFDHDARRPERMTAIAAGPYVITVCCVATAATSSARMALCSPSKGECESSDAGTHARATGLYLGVMPFSTAATSFST